MAWIMTAAGLETGLFGRLGYVTAHTGDMAMVEGSDSRMPTRLSRVTLRAACLRGALLKKHRF
jgi:hypothetical protein